LIVDGLENLQTKTHIRGMEKTIALTAVVAILIFVAVLCPVGLAFPWRREMTPKRP
jgi:hypothetical protein